jgi:hypothetical protein
MTTPASPPADCCSDMQRARVGVPRSLIRRTPSGVLLMTVGIGPGRDGGTAYYEQVVAFCPFCGVSLAEPMHTDAALA